MTEHFVYTVRSLERMGVSAVIIEDKTGLKKNSLFGTEVVQTQDSIEHFSEKIAAGKRAQKTKEFMICLLYTSASDRSSSSAGGLTLKGSE